MDISVRKRGDVQLIQLRGDLRLGPPVDELRQLFDELLGSGEYRFALKLSDVPSIDSSGIGLLMKYLANTKQRGGAVKLVNPTSFTIKTLRAVGVLNLFEVFEDDESAVASFGLATAS
jgi:anti-sigma B factor antagonist